MTTSPTSAGRGRALRFLFLLVLLGILFAAGCILVRDRDPGAPAGPAGAPQAPGPAPKATPGNGPFGTVLISASPRPPEGAPGPGVFRSGAEVFLHVTLTRPASLHVLGLDSRLNLTSVSPVSIDGNQGTNVLGPYEIEDTAGEATATPAREALIVLAGEGGQVTEDFTRLLDRTAQAVRGAGVQFQERLAAIVRTLGAHDGITCATVEYDHSR